MTNAIRTWRLAAVAGLTLGAFACSESPTDLVDLDGPIPSPQFVEIDLSSTAGGQETVNDAVWTFPVPFNVGTGQINPFLSVQANPNEEGFNTDASPLPLDTKRPNFTNALPLNHVPTIEGPGMGLFRELILDANEANSEPDALFSIDRFDLWLCDDPDAATFEERSEFQSNADCALVYDIDDDLGGSDVDYIRATDAVTSGSGLDLDYQILIPEANFIAAAGAVGADLSDCAYQGVEADPCGAFLILDVRMGFQGGDLVTGATFEEMSTIKRPFVNVTKTANTSLTRTHQWDIEKSVDIAQHDLLTGESGTSEYTVDVIYDGVVDSDWAVSGDITIVNPSDDDVVIEGVTDEISGVGAVTVTCPVTFPHTLGDGETLVCTYASDLPDGANRTNTATVDIEDLAVGIATADVDFAAATITEVDATATIDDSVEGALGNATAPNEPQFTYSRTFTCDGDEGQHDNTATITADDTGTQNSDDASVVVTCTQPDLDTETAWASNELGVPLTLPFNPSGGNWATYVAYFGVEKTVTLFAGQTNDVGTVHFSAPAGGLVTITIVLTGGTTFADGSVVAVQDYASAPSGNPSPGSFDHKESPDSPTMHTIVVPENDFYAVHAVVQ